MLFHPSVLVSRDSAACHHLADHLRYLQPLLDRCFNLLKLVRNKDRTGAELLHAVRDFYKLDVKYNAPIELFEEVIVTLADDDIDADAWDVAFDRLRSEYLR